MRSRMECFTECMCWLSKSERGELIIFVICWIIPSHFNLLTRYLAEIWSRMMGSVRISFIMFRYISENCLILQNYQKNSMGDGRMGRTLQAWT